MQYDEYEFSFTDDLEIGVPLIDRQHREYFRRLKLLLNKCREGLSYRDIKENVKFLEEYAYDHLDAEEFLMEGKKYPPIEIHKKAHKVFKDKLQAIIKEISAADGFTETNVSNLLGHSLNWFLDHIKHTDIKLGEYLKSLPT